MTKETIDIEAVMDVIEQMESDGDVDAIGDNGAAYGCMQIQAGCLADFNKWNGSKFVLEDMLGESGRELSRKVFVDYMAHYATEKRLGSPVRPVDMARIWNGGPNGYAKTATRGYGYKFTLRWERAADTKPETLGGKKTTKKSSKRRA